MLGMKVKDRITGYSGIVIGRCEYLTGCRQLLVQPTTLKADDGQPTESRWIDIDRVEVVDAHPKEWPAEAPATSPGPDKPAPRK